MTIDDIRQIAKRHRVTIDIQINQTGRVGIKVSKPGRYDSSQIIENRDIETCPFDIVMRVLKNMI